MQEIHTYIPVQEGADHAGVVHCHLGWSGQGGVLSDTFVDFGI